METILNLLTNVNFVWTIVMIELSYRQIIQTYNTEQQDTKWFSISEHLFQMPFLFLLMSVFVQRTDIPDE